jgi:hypothetical protein
LRLYPEHFILSDAYLGRILHDRYGRIRKPSEGAFARLAALCGDLDEMSLFEPRAGPAPAA